MSVDHCDEGRGYWIHDLATNCLTRTIHVSFVESQPVNQRTVLSPRRPLGAMALQQPLPPPVPSQGGISANLTCVDTPQIIVPTSSLFLALEGAHGAP
jgi:hypothetical protein